MPDLPRTAADWTRLAAKLDAADPLACFRADFHLPAGVIYLDGNSLGPVPRAGAAALSRLLREWTELGITGWTDAHPPWVDLGESLASGVGTLIGAAADEVAVTGSTTANLHQLLASLFDPAADRRPGSAPSAPPPRVLLADELNFASDVHALSSHLRLRGLDPAQHLRKVRSRDGRTLTEEDILAALTPDVQLAVLPTVLYVSGQLLDTARLAREARARGIILGWDCSHSIGAVPHHADAEDWDFAFWCSYKYLNAGPGAVAGLFLNRRHFGRRPGLAGWWGVRPERRFALSQEHEPASGAAGLQLGTPHLLSLAPLQGSLSVFAAAGGVPPLREKSLALTHFLLELADEELAPFGLRAVTPRESARRGGHVALAHPQAWPLTQALRAAGVICDCRPPDIVRLAPAPLFNTFGECREAVARLRAILADRRHERFPAQPGLVT